MRTIDEKRRGFSLTEMAIVLGVIGSLLAALWSVASSVQQAGYLSRAIQDITYVTTAVRNVYSGSAGFTGDPRTVIPAFITQNAFPASIINPGAATVCSGSAASTFLRGPWPTASDTCGTLRFCPWNYGTTTGCVFGAIAPNTTSQQYFAVEFADLTYDACLALVTNVDPMVPTGLKGIYVGGANISMGTIAVKAAVASGACSNAVPNTVDIIYTLRPPST